MSTLRVKRPRSFKYRFPEWLRVRADGKVLIVCESLTGMLLSYN